MFNKNFFIVLFFLLILGTCFSTSPLYDIFSVGEIANSIKSAQPSGEFRSSCAIFDSGSTITSEELSNETDLEGIFFVKGNIPLDYNLEFESVNQSKFVKNNSPYNYELSSIVLCEPTFDDLNEAFSRLSFEPNFSLNPNYCEEDLVCCAVIFTTGEKCQGKYSAGMSSAGMSKGIQWLVEIIMLGFFILIPLVIFCAVIFSIKNHVELISDTKIASIIVSMLCLILFVLTSLKSILFFILFIIFGLVFLLVKTNFVVKSDNKLSLLKLWALRVLLVIYCLILFAFFIFLLNLFIIV